MTTRSPLRIALLVAALAALLAVPAAVAGKGGKPGGHGGGGTTTGGSGTMTVVLLNSADSTPNWGEKLTFTVSTTTTTRPFVSLECFQGGARVYSMSAGFFADYPFTTTYTLSSSYWTGGAASCTATLYYTNAKGASTVISTMSVPVAA